MVSNMIGQTISHYRITEKLGEGGMGVVYKAEDTKLDRTVALKFLAPELTRDPEAKTRFTQEAKAAAALSHANICTIHEIDEFAGQSFIAMECYEGETLGQRIARGPLPLDEAVDISRQIAQGLAKAHDQGIVHRDIKPANIFITSDGTVKILDFGLAKLTGQTRLTNTGTTLGTAAFFSPEQARGAASDHRSDIWSLGVTLYAMVTGQLPFKGEYEALAYSILNEAPEPLTGVRTGVPRDLEQIVNKCMEKEAGERYQTAVDLIADLRRLKRTMLPTGREPVTSRATEKGHSSVAPGSGKRVRSWIFVALAVLMVVVAIVIFRPFFASIDRQPIEGRKMLVVLPFESLGHSEDKYFADGISEEITSRLATLPELGVISRTSAVHYSETDKIIRQIGEELGVDYVLEGTVRWDHGQGRISRVRITPQLIRVSDDTHLWTDRYDRELKDIFEVQSDIAKKVVEQLDITLLEGQNRALEAKSTENLDAYQAYLRGLHHRQYMSLSDQARVQPQAMFELAVNLDPGFARAFAELSIVHSWLYYSPGTSSQDHLAMAKAAADSAVKIQPELPEAHLALGYYWGNRNNEAALKEFALAKEGLPNDFRVLKLRGFTQHRGGNLEAALASYKEAFELSPMDAEMAFHITFVLT